MNKELLQQQLDELHKTWVIDETEHSPYVEIYMIVKEDGAVEDQFTMEWFPEGRGPEDTGRYGIRTLSIGTFDDEMQRKYEIFGAMVGRVAYYGP